MVIILLTMVSNMDLNTEDVICPHIIQKKKMFGSFFLYFTALNSTLLKLKLPFFDLTFFPLAFSNGEDLHEYVGLQNII